MPYRPNDIKELEESLLAYLLTRSSGSDQGAWEFPGSTSRYSAEGAAVRFSEQDYFTVQFLLPCNFTMQF